MKKLILPVIVVSAVCGSLAHAGVVLGTNIQNGAGDTLIASSANVPLASGFAGTGYFATGFDVASAVAANDFVALYSNFTALTSSSIGSTSSDFGADIAGFYSNPSTDYGAPGADLLGKTIYTFFGNGATLEASLDFGLVQFPITIDADTPLPDSNNANLFTGGNWTVLIGTEGGTAEIDLTAIGAGVQVNPTIQLVPIPEPSVALLGALGGLALLRRRR